MRRTLIALVLALGMLACGAGDDDSTEPSRTSTEPEACSDVFADGRPTADVVADADRPCEADGDLTVFGVGAQDCASQDGQWYYNDRGYGVGGGEWHARDGVTPQFDDEGHLTVEGHPVC